jgi:hypothetical protein
MQRKIKMPRQQQSHDPAAANYPLAPYQHVFLTLCAEMWEQIAEHATPQTWGRMRLTCRDMFFLLTTWRVYECMMKRNGFVLAFYIGNGHLMLGYLRCMPKWTEGVSLVEGDCDPPVQPPKRYQSEAYQRLHPLTPYNLQIGYQLFVDACESTLSIHKPEGRRFFTRAYHHTRSHYSNPAPFWYFYNPRQGSRKVTSQYFFKSKPPKQRISRLHYRRAMIAGVMKRSAVRAVRRKLRVMWAQPPNAKFKDELLRAAIESGMSQVDLEPSVYGTPGVLRAPITHN